MKTLAQQINESFINEGKELEKNTHGKTNNIYVSSSDSKICLQIPYIFPGGELSLAHNQLELLRSLHNNDKLKKEYNKFLFVQRLFMCLIKKFIKNKNIRLQSQLRIKLGSVDL